jgi:prepilin peptidase CpaA
MLNMSNALASAAVLLVGVTASGFDVTTRRIPNALTIGAAGCGLAFHLLTGGLSGFGLSFIGLAAGLAIFFPVFALGGMGAGDVKLLACIGAWLGPIGALWTAMFAAIAGGVMAVVVVVLRGYVRQAFANIWLLLSHWRVVGFGPLSEVTLQHGRGPRLAYAVPITAGALVTLWLH